MDGLLKPERKRAIEESMSEILDAAAVIDKLQKQVAALKKKVAGHEKTIDKIWAWKMEQEMKGE